MGMGMDARERAEALDEDTVVAELERAAEELERVGQQLLDAELRLAFLDGVLECLLTNLDVAVVAVGASGDVEAVSPAVCDAAGLRAARVLSRPFAMVASELGWAPAVAAVDQAVAGEHRPRAITVDGWRLKVVRLPDGADGAVVVGERA